MTLSSSPEERGREKGKKSQLSDFFCHRGFLRVFSALLPHIESAVADPTLRKILTVGYSHGAALAVLLHEYLWQTRPDLRENGLQSYGFGCPRVVWGILPPRLAVHWQTFTVIRNIEDAVTHLPPALLGYRHVGEMLTVGEAGKYSPIDAHRPGNIMAELRAYEQKHEKEL